MTKPFYSLFLDCFAPWLYFRFLHPLQINKSINPLIDVTTVPKENLDLKNLNHKKCPYPLEGNILVTKATDDYAKDGGEELFTKMSSIKERNASW